MQWIPRPVSVDDGHAGKILPHPLWPTPRNGHTRRSPTTLTWWPCPRGCHSCPIPYFPIGRAPPKPGEVAGWGQAALGDACRGGERGADMDVLRSGSAVRRTGHCTQCKAHRSPVPATPRVVAGPSVLLSLRGCLRAEQEWREGAWEGGRRDHQAFSFFYPRVRTQAPPSQPCCRVGENGRCHAGNAVGRGGGAQGHAWPGH